LLFCALAKAPSERDCPTVTFFVGGFIGAGMALCLEELLLTIVVLFVFKGICTCEKPDLIQCNYPVITSFTINKPFSIMVLIKIIGHTLT
jgi:hypothetical protein